MLASFMASAGEISITNILMLLAGLGVFLVGMNMMSGSMEKLANTSLRSLLNSVTNNRIKGVGVGAGMTVIIQSSSATTVMTVGFVNAGILTLTQAVPIIMGANIGTTITAQLAALQSFDITTWLMLLSFIGAFMTILAKKDKTKTLGAILAGLGMLFIGLDIMSDAMRVMRDAPFFQETLQTITNPILLLVIGALFTALIQSSSAATGIIVSMAAAGIAIGGGGNAVLYVILGTNIGTCVTALLSSIGANANGKRASLVHLMFNVIGSIAFMIMLVLWPSFFEVTFQTWFPGAPATQIAMFHTVFNVITTLILLPLSNVLVKVAQVLIKDKADDKEVMRCKFIDDRFLETPAIAVAQSVKEVTNAIMVAQEALNLSINAFTSKDYSKLDEVELYRKQLKFYSSSITKYIIKVSNKKVAYADEKTLGMIHHALTDVDRLSELAENIRRYCRTVEETGLSFSPAVMDEIKHMQSVLDDQFAAVVDVFEYRVESRLPEIEAREDIVDNCKKSLLEAHIKRLNEGECKIESSSVFINLVGNLERVGDHLAKIARGAVQ
ncbi:MAG: Na/Pi cotransporter family protein [Clostridiales bacterium]|nr:Na/Pi cotransporter family protein [Clostridiales bacterium]